MLDSERDMVTNRKINTRSSTRSKTTMYLNNQTNPQAQTTSTSSHIDAGAQSAGTASRAEYPVTIATTGRQTDRRGRWRNPSGLHTPCRPTPKLMTSRFEPHTSSVDNEHTGNERHHGNWRYVTQGLKHPGIVSQWFDPVGSERSVRLRRPLLIGGIIASPLCHSSILGLFCNDSIRWVVRGL